MAQALYRKWRSQTFDEVVGQEHVTQTLRNALRDERIAHAYLFSGPRGTGKTSTARILAKALNCTAPEDERPCNECHNCVAINEGRMIDLIEIDAASNNSVDDIRELREKVGFRPSEGRYKIYIIDEVHMLSTSAFNALLKTLEEPPPHTRFVLATTEPHKIPATVLSRCQRFDFRRIPAVEIMAHLRHIATEEGFGAEDDALLAIARSAQGCMRDAVSLLDQMLSFGAETVTLAQVQQVLGAVSTEAVAALVDAVAAGDIAAGLTQIQALMVEGASLNEFCQQVVEHLRGVMLLQMTGDPTLLTDLPGEVVKRMQAQAEQLAMPQTLHAVKRFSEAIPELKGGYQPQLPLEMALIEAVQGTVAVATQVTVETPAQTASVATSAPVQPAPPTPAPASTETPGTPSKAPAAPAQSKPEPAAPADDVVEAPLDERALAKLAGRNWDQFMLTVNRQLGIKTQASLRAVRDIAVTSDTVAFAFGTNQFSRDMIATPEMNAKVAGLLASHLGRAVKLECQMGDQAKVLNPIGANSGSAQDDGPDPLVEYAVSQLHAQVLEDNEA
ncbi:MAG: DNA polymerase III subunit gamma/tau [Caldilineaceae bacterium]|nr:DNA polymerase III subunit gamma/tau [Caldilineaceae bacterium]